MPGQAEMENQEAVRRCSGKPPAKREQYQAAEEDTVPSKDPEIMLFHIGKQKMDGNHRSHIGT